MKIRLLTERSGLTGYALAGDVIDVADDEALRMLRAGHAEQVEPQTATRPRPENTARRNPRK